MCVCVFWGGGGTHLPGEALSVLGLQETVVHLVGAGDDGCHGILVVRRGDGEEGEGSQREVIHTAGHATLIVAVRVQTRGQGREGGRMKKKPLASGRAFSNQCVAIVL